jgi:phenylpropionate dioxygenase-like ring-hydroxylating dioxygenase large terminal subunit
VAHLDRCPHRNVPLSGGRCLPDNSLECAYHGWRFSPDGGCVKIPGLVSSLKKGQRVETFATCEEYGIVWLCPEEGHCPNFGPHPLVEAKGDDYTVITRRVQYPGGLFATVENALDVPHTAVLHRGLFRGGERQSVDVMLRRYSEWAEAEYIGEAPPGGLMARLLSLGSKGAKLTVQHWDRFLLPSILQVEYRLGPRTHLLVTGFCTPHSEAKTSLFAVVCLRTPLFKFLERLLVRFIEPVAMRVVAQDVEILGAQSETVERFGGERFMSTEIDVLSTAIRRVLKDAADQQSRLLSGEQASEPRLGEAGCARSRQSDEPREVTELKILA